MTMKEMLFVREIIIERRLGHTRVVHDILHRRAGVTAAGEAVQRGVQDLPLCFKSRIHKPTER